MEPNKVVRLFFRSAQGGVDLIHTAAEARQYLELWKRGSGLMQGVTADGVNWSARVEDVAAVVILPLPSQQSVAPTGRLRPGTSGIN